jgi:hypothetical protein
MTAFQPGDRVAIKTDFYDSSNPDYNSGEGYVVQKGCSSKCICGDYYEVLHDLDARPDINWGTADGRYTTPYNANELTKID